MLDTLRRRVELGVEVDGLLKMIDGGFQPINCSLLPGEATQQVFLRVFDQIGGFEARSRLSTWLFRVAANTTLNLMKSRRRLKSA